MTLPEFLLSARKRQRPVPSQRAIAAQVGVAQATISAYERGRAKPRPDKVPRVAKAYRVNTKELACLLVGA